MSPLVRFRGVQKTYDGVHLVVQQLDLDIRRGEFLTLLGPSGSGKTTTLMMLAGFESPTAGDIVLDGRPITRTPPHKRHFGMVFQNYALFPHLTVGQNVAYPLTVRSVAEGRAGAAGRARARHGAARRHGRARCPAQLSGGQQQRVALARALVFEPQLVLMDEPLGALDKQLREHMQIELKDLHRQLGVTFVYVTHDQGEALTMSDRVAVFNDGAIQQIDVVDRHVRGAGQPLRRRLHRRQHGAQRHGARRAVDDAAIAAASSLTDGRVITGRQRQRRGGRRARSRPASGPSASCCTRAPLERGNVLQAQRRRRDLFRRPPAAALRRRRRPGALPPSSCRCRPAVVPQRRRRRLARVPARAARASIV